MRLFIAAAAMFVALKATDLAQAYPGVAPTGTATAEYYSDTGEIIVSANGVVGWFIGSASSSLTGDAPLLPPFEGTLYNDFDDSIGQITINFSMAFTNLNLGSVAALDLPPEDLRISWNTELGGAEYESLPLTYLSAPPLGNTPPTAFLSGPYEVDIDNEPLNVFLDASSSIDDGLNSTLSYKWDLDDDGVFEIDTGIASSYEVDDVTSTFGGVGSYPVAVEIFDGEFFDIASTVVDLVPDTTPIPLGPGPAPFDTAIAAYDPATGRIIASVNDVINWYVESASRSLTGDPAMNLPAAGGLVSDNNEIIGETSFSSMSYTNLDLGNVAAVGLPLSDLSIVWTPEFGPSFSQPLVLLSSIPEPAGLVLAALGLTHFIARRRRRSAA